MARAERKAFRTKEVTKDHFIKIRVTEDEKQALQQKAWDCRMSLSEFLLKAGLGRQTRTKVDTEIILNLMKVNEGVRAAFHDSGRQYPELMQVIDASVRAIDRIWPTGKIE